MPEGDTIFRTAVRLRQVILGREVTAARQGPNRTPLTSLVGKSVGSIEARGKHLLIHVGSETVHSHLGMTGSWHVYAPGEPWRKPARRAMLTLETRDCVCVCFSPKTLEILSPDALRRHRHLRRLGPDLLGELPSRTEIVERFRVHNRTPIGEALMNQTIVCGIGNVYKSEVLFVCRVNPFVRVESLSDARILQLVDGARDLMRKNLQGFPRRTRFRLDGRRQWVYGRSGRRCFECGQAIRIRCQGDLGRTTFWCPSCQPAEEQRV
jgi:endonuclease-8